MSNTVAYWCTARFWKIYLFLLALLILIFGSAWALAQHKFRISEDPTDSVLALVLILALGYQVVPRWSHEIHRHSSRVWWIFGSLLIASVLLIYTLACVMQDFGA